MLASQQNPAFPLGHHHRPLCFHPLHAFEFDLNVAGLEAEKIPFDVTFSFNRQTAQGLGCVPGLFQGSPNGSFTSRAAEGTSSRLFPMALAHQLALRCGGASVAGVRTYILGTTSAGSVQVVCLPRAG